MEMWSKPRGLRRGCETMHGEWVLVPPPQERSAGYSQVRKLSVSSVLFCFPSAASATMTVRDKEQTNKKL